MSFPEAYKMELFAAVLHQESWWCVGHSYKCGACRGQWLGRKKQGIGSYRYLRNAKYEGEWHNNLKDGFGVYHFAKGGLYKVRAHAAQ